MLFKDRNLQYRVEQLEKKVEGLDKQYAIKLVERIVFGLLAVAGTTAMGAWITSVLGLFGG